MNAVGGEPPCFNLPPGETVCVYLGLGTNLGDRAHNLGVAVERIAQLVAIDAVSSIYETEPVGYADQPEFWNLVLRGRTDLPVAQLMRELIGIEQAMGRERTFRNAPRVIDIDILLYDDVISAAGDVQLPHPRMHERAFVLKPLLEIAPDLVDPRTKRRYAGILASSRLERAEIVAPPIQVNHETH